MASERLSGQGEVGHARSLRAIKLFDGQSALHECGYRGAGQTIALLDSGVTNSALEPWVAWRESVTGVLDARMKTVHGDRMAQAMIEIAPECTLGVTTVFDRSGLVFREAIARGIGKARERGVQLINLSVGIRRVAPICSDRALCVACRTAADAAAEGAFMIVAAGNFGAETMPSCPGSAPDVLSIRASNGPSGASRTDENAVLDTGTSVSAAIVSASFALMLGGLPELTFTELQTAVARTGTALIKSRGTQRAHFYRAYRYAQHTRSGGLVDDDKANRLLDDALGPARMTLGPGRTLTQLVAALTRTERAAARDAFEQANTLAPWSANVRLGLGLLAEVEGLGIAFAHALEVVRLDWSIAEGHSLLARALRAIGQPGVDVENRIADLLTSGDELGAADVLFDGRESQQLS